MLKYYIFLFVSFTAVLFYCDSAPVVYTITFQQYTSIKIGWTQDQIKKLVGTSGKVILQLGTGSTAMTTIQYTGSKSTLAVATFILKGKILLTKAQIGLDTGIYPITYKQYTTIKIGWTPTQVKTTTGNAGNTISESDTGTVAAVMVQYTPVGSTYGQVQLGYVGGKLVSKFQIGFDTAVKNKITFQQYTSIKIGWTQAQITKLLGGSGTVLSEVGSRGSPFQMTMVQYTGSQSSLTLALFTFQNGILSSKAQTGLDTGIYTITEQQYTKIQTGWTRDQVANLVGSPGNAVSEAGTGAIAAVMVQYSPVGSTYGQVQLGYVGGKLVSKFQIGFDIAVKNKITFQQYTSIKIGWTQAQITKILGGSGTVLSEVGSQGSPFQMTMVQYTGSQSSLTLALFTFQNGILSSKAQTGLDTGIYTITEQQYTKIQTGWTRDQVTNLVGSPGNAVSEAGTGAIAAVMVQYTPVGSTYGQVQLTFSGGKLMSKFGFGLK